VFVTDNNSKDNSCAYVKEYFPEVILIENKKNVGFSSANNQAIKQSDGEYILLLNPDTIIPEDTFVNILEFADDHPDAGGIGVKMNDGKGHFLPESKRAFPSPAVSFYKIFGLSKMFPKSKRFAKYHLSFLNKDEIHKVDVLSGAFMLLRKSALDKTGLLDETFFMYGEDIDLSYRIVKSGFSNYYYPDVNIIHYKGESTKKGSLNYVYMFYNAMIIFAKKHFSGKNALFFSFLIKSAIIFRATLSVIKRIFKTIFLPVLDVIVFYSGFYVLKPIWEIYKFHHLGHYPPEYMMYAVPAYIALWIFSIMLVKGYQIPLNSKKLFKGILSGTLIILIIYSLLNEEYRYSRLLLLAVTVWALFFSWLIRTFFIVLKLKDFSFQNKKSHKFLMISDDNQKEIAVKILQKNFENNILISKIECSDKNIISEKIKREKISNLILFAENIPYKEIISFLTDEIFSETEVQIAYSVKEFIVGSQKVIVSDELFVAEHFMLNKKFIRIQKRLFDILISFMLILLSPVLILLTDDKRNYFSNIFNVLTGKNSLVGYMLNGNTNGLPMLKEGILSPVNYPVFDKEEMGKINFRYARDYHLTDDFYIFYKSFNKIGNKKL